MKQREIHSKLLDYIDKVPLPDEDISEVTLWINASPKNRESYEVLKEISHQKTYLNSLNKINLDNNLERFQSNIAQSKSYTNQKRIVKLSSQTISFTKIAAAIIILLATTFFVVSKVKYSKVEQVYSKHNKSQVVLIDGSTVEVNAGSKLSYPTKFNRRKRAVKLQGEAFFSIHKDQKKPFYVYLEKATVQVLGTSFNISEEKGGLIKVQVITGLVSFYENKHVKNKLKLEAGQEGIYFPDKHKFIQTNYSSENFLYWKTRKLTFVNQTLENVFKDLEKSYGVKFIVSDPQILQNRLTTECEQQELDVILEEMAILFAFKYNLKGNTVYIEP